MFEFPKEQRNFVLFLTDCGNDFAIKVYNFTDKPIRNNFNDEPVWNNSTAKPLLICISQEYLFIKFFL